MDEGRRRHTFKLLRYDPCMLVGFEFITEVALNQHLHEISITPAPSLAPLYTLSPSRTTLLSGLFDHNLDDEYLGWCGDFVESGKTNTTFAVVSWG